MLFEGQTNKSVVKYLFLNRTEIKLTNLYLVKIIIKGIIPIIWKIKQDSQRTLIIQNFFQFYFNFPNHELDSSTATKKANLKMNNTFNLEKQENGHEI